MEWQNPKVLKTVEATCAVLIDQGLIDGICVPILEVDEATG
jgi:hypothetical protein